MAHAALTDTGRTVLVTIEATAGRVAEDVVADAGWAPGDTDRLLDLLNRFGASGLFRPGG